VVVVDIAKVRDAAVLKTGEGIRSTASGRRVMRVRMGVEFVSVCFGFLECARGLVVDVIAVLIDRLEGAGNGDGRCDRHSACRCAANILSRGYI
jgi:hypothetical protein